MLADGGLEPGVDFFLAFSPEGEDPGNPQFSAPTIPKVVGGLEPASLELAAARQGRGRPRFDARFLRMMFVGIAASFPLIVVAAAIYFRLSPFRSALTIDEDEFGYRTAGPAHGVFPGFFGVFFMMHCNSM